MTFYILKRYYYKPCFYKICIIFITLYWFISFSRVSILIVRQFYCIAKIICRLFETFAFSTFINNKLIGDTRKIFVLTDDESNPARVLVGCKPINNKSLIHNKSIFKRFLF